MKETGIVRRVDDLGRIVLPKEIRKMVHIRENDPLEICIENNNIVLRRYQVLKPECLERVYAALERVTQGFLAVYDSGSLVKVCRKNNISVPSLVPENWEWNTEDTFKHDLNILGWDECKGTLTVTVYPIILCGQRVGYVLAQDANPDYVAGIIAMLRQEV